MDQKGRNDMVEPWEPMPHDLPPRDAVARRAHTTPNTSDLGDCGCSPRQAREPGDRREPPAVRSARRMAAQRAGTYHRRKNDDGYFYDI